MRLIVSIVLSIVAIPTALFLAFLLHIMIENGEMKVELISLQYFIRAFSSNKKLVGMFLAIYGLFFTLVLMIFLTFKERMSYESPLQDITENIQTPVHAGQNQYGSASWLEKERIANRFNSISIDKTNSFFEKLMTDGQKDIEDLNEVDEKIRKLDIYMDKLYAKFNRKNRGDNAGGGIVLGMSKSRIADRVFVEDSDTHTLVIGSTRSGKSRTVALQSIAVQALAGESMINSDPKGELLNYTSPFLESLGYEIVVLDFKNPLKSSQYNYLQNIINAVNEDDIPKAIDFAWDITSALVGEAKGEKIWNDGEASVIASAILSAVFDNKDSPQYQNLTNVYHFISEMCTETKEDLPLNKYLEDLEDDHPAKALIGISRVAPSRTRGSFFTASLVTLKLFTSPLIYYMTKESDFDIYTTGIKKRALFIVLPDEKETYYSLASFFVSQHYETMVGVADSHGGRLPRNINFNLDEFGNFAKIAYFGTKLTVGGGRGIRFNLFIQSLSQIDEKYGKEMAKTIKGNCQTWIYLQAEDIETLEEISKKLGNYTVSSGGMSSSYSTGQSNSQSASVNLVSRPLLTAEEIGRIQRPHTLVLSREKPAIFYAPDISEYYFNKMFGMGDESHNIILRQKREKKRAKNEGRIQIELWGIWKKYNNSQEKHMDKHYEDFMKDLVSDHD